MVLKELIFNSFYLGGCDGFEIIESADLTLPGNNCLNDIGTYIYEYHNTGHGGLERTAF